MTVSTELHNLRNLHGNQGYRLFHNLFLPRMHARAHTHTHTQRHTGFFIMPSFPFSHICLALTPYLTLIAWTPWAQQHILLDMQRGILYVFYSQELLWGNKYYSHPLLHVSHLPIASSSDSTDSANISQELARSGLPIRTLFLCLRGTRSSGKHSQFILCPQTRHPGTVTPHPTNHSVPCVQTHRHEMTSFHT